MFLIPSILGFITQLVPNLLDHLVGKSAGDVAQKVIDVVQTVTGTTSQEAAADALKADPTKLLELQAKLAQIALENAQADYAEMTDARAMEKQAVQSGSLTAWMPYFFAFLVLCVWIAVTLGMVPQLNDVAGARLDAVLSMILGFVYGHQRSTTTDNLLADSIPQNMVKGAGLSGPLAR